MKVLVSRNSARLYEINLMDEDLIHGGDLFIGREEDCHIILEDKRVSRYQACFKIENEKLVLKNLSNSIGIIIDGVQTAEGQIRERSLVTIADFSLEITQVDNLLMSISSAGQVEEESTSNAPTDDDMEITSVKEVEDIDESTDIFDDPSPEMATEIIDEISDQDNESEFDSDDNEDDNEFGMSENDSDDDVSSEEENSFDNEEESFENNDSFSEDGFSDDAFSDDGAFVDDGFGDDGFGGSDNSESTQVFQSFANFTLRLFGENAPFDRYKIDEAEIRIGRDKEKCQIVLDDPEVSGVHAIIKKNIISCTLEDLDSSNGTILNGERINKQELISGDEFLIGTTSFTVEVSSDIIEAEKDRLMPVDHNQEVEVEEIVEEEVDFDEFSEGDESEFSVGEVEEKSLIKKILKDPKKKRIAIFGSVGLILLLLLLPSEEKKKTGQPKKKAVKAKVKDKKKSKLKLSDRQKAKLEIEYVLALEKYNAGEFSEAREHINEVIKIDPQYKDTQTLKKRIEEEDEKLIRLKEQELAEKERLKTQLRIQKLVEKARKAVEKREVSVAENYFAQILEIDPENIDIPSLKLEIEAYKKEKERVKFEKERKEAERRKKVEALKPGKKLFIQEKWYQAIDELQNFTEIKDMDEDLLQEGTDMLLKSRRNLLKIVNPLSSKARSFKEGQDLKQAYETYGQVLKYDPANEEALNERDKIFDLLKQRSKKLYREALVAESLSLFDKAKEKFQEVQQISPLNSEYYLKATKKLENYLE